MAGAGDAAQSGWCPGPGAGAGMHSHRTQVGEQGRATGGLFKELVGGWGWLPTTTCTSGEGEVEGHMPFQICVWDRGECRLSATWLGAPHPPWSITQTLFCE